MRAALAAALLLAAVPALAAPKKPDPEPRGPVYKVTKPEESYFDVAARTALLKRVDDAQLRQLRDKLAMGPSCRQMKDRPVLDSEVTLPSFHQDPMEWKLAIEPLSTFEQTVGDLAGAWVATGDRYYANCLVDVLEKWAQEKGLSKFQFSPSRPQAWYALESMIFSAALAYSTVTGTVEIAPARRRTIEEWLQKIAENHFKLHTFMQSCCDEHFYRRSLYMTVVGVVTGNDALFRTGLRAVPAALEDLNERGAFNLALRRGWRAIYYQNYILQHVVMIMQVADRQGYDLFATTSKGRSMASAVSFLLRGVENPHAVDGLPPGEQDIAFTRDGRFFSWMEIWLEHYENAAMSKLVRHYRPIVSPAGGGHMTLYFKIPEDPLSAYERDLQTFDVVRKAEGDFNERFPLLKRKMRTQ
jgi:poly(beta-D-mannuronate) lyase